MLLVVKTIVVSKIPWTICSWGFKSPPRQKIIGRIPEMVKGVDCKSIGGAFGGSNPPPTTEILKMDNI